MRSFPNLYPVTTAATSFTTVPVDKGDSLNFWVGVLFSGSDVAGTLTLEVSDDKTTWFTTGSSIAVTTSTSQSIEKVNTGFHFYRIRWVYTSGTGNISVRTTIAEPYLARGG